MQIDSQANRNMIAQARRREARGPWMLLLSEVLHLAGSTGELIRHTEKPWSSVTFAGARHTISLSYEGDDAMDLADDFIAALPEHEFTIPRHIVADATVTFVDQRAFPLPKVTIEVELLLVEES